MCCPGVNVGCIRLRLRARIEPALSHSAGSNHLFLCAMRQKTALSSTVSNTCWLTIQRVRRFLAPMWVAVLSPALLKERPGKFTFVAIPLCLLGVALIAEAKTGDLATHHIRTIGIIVAVFQV